jgi:cyclopropane fatty-acyl-phospholipid synthase-like methyltransferase
MGEPSTRRVADYYDRNTGRFLRFGGGRDAATIHRRLWAPGVTTSDQALRQIHRLLAGWLRPAIESAEGDVQLLDLGCGVGGTALDLAARLEANVIGLTLSPLQAQQASARAAALEVEHACRFAVADFHRLPLRCRATAAYAIESFAHAAEPQRFFAEARRCLAPGSRLILVDDFLAEGADPSGRAWPWDRARWARRFAEGWRLGSLMTASQAAELARAAGFEPLSIEDLTPWLRLPPGWLLPLLRLAATLHLPSAYWESLAGGIALQVCEQRGWARYQAVILCARP